MQVIGTDIHGMRSLRHPIKAWIDGVPVEDEAREQLERIADMPFIHKHVAVMPDVHLGKGATVGSVIATRGAIIPAAVGVDLGCGMVAARLNLRADDLPDNLFEMRSLIESHIPHGRTHNGGTNDKGAWGEPPQFVVDAISEKDDGLFMLGFDQIMGQHPKLRTSVSRIASQLGTLGTGNHFVEVCLDENGDVWLMLHSGSRGVGNQIGQYFIERAKRHMEQWFISLPDKDLAYLPDDTQDFKDYLNAVEWAQDYAALNREIMLRQAIKAVSRAMNREIEVTQSAVNCHHNYVSRERHFGENVYVTRKGAVQAMEGQLGIIPGSMGAKSFIVSGKGNRESFCSCSHGAGRKMSRTAAKKAFTLADHIAATAGVECRKDEDVIDETPQAYKDIDAVMAAQADLVEIVHTLRQVCCVKG